MSILSKKYCFFIHFFPTQFFFFFLSNKKKKMKNILFLFSLFLFIFSTHAFITEIPPNGKDCIFEMFDSGKSVNVFFEVLYGGNEDIDIYVRI